MVLKTNPEQVTLVPDSSTQLTSDHGWDTIKEFDYLKDIIALFKSKNIRTSIFVDPVEKMIEGAARVGTDRIELYTEFYAANYESNKEEAIKDYVKAAKVANNLNIGINAGHDLNLINLQYFYSKIENLKGGINWPCFDCRCPILWDGKYCWHVFKMSKTMKLNFKKIGEGNPLLIIHGLFGSSDNWGMLGKKFAEKYTVYLIDLRNHGRSPHSSTMNYEAMADDLYELIQDEKILNPSLIGHSMGGKAALFFNEKYNSVLHKLIVADIGIKPYPMHHDVIIRGLKNVNLNVISSRKEAHNALAKYVTELGIQQFLLKNLYWIEKGKLAWRMNLEVIIDNIHEILTEIKVQGNKTETLFLRGELSNYILEEDIDQLKIAMPNSSVKTIKNVGHWLHAENPTEFYELTNIIYKIKKERRTPLFKNDKTT